MRTPLPLFAWMLLSTAALAEGRVSHSELQFSFTPPPGFVAYADGITSPDDLYAFAKGDPAGEHGAVVLLVQRMRGTIGREPTDLAMIPKELQASEKTVAWRGFPLQAIRTVQQGMVMHLVQVPTKQEAIQFVVGGDPHFEAELEPALLAALASVEGESNWLTDGQRMSTIARGIAKLAATIAVIAGVVVVVARRKKK